MAISTQVLPRLRRRAAPFPRVTTWSTLEMFQPDTCRLLEEEEEESKCSSGEERTAMSTSPCLQGHHPMPTRSPSHASKVTIPCLQGHHPMPARSPSHASKVTIPCLQGHHPMPPRSPSHASKVTIPCLQGYHPMPPKSPSHASKVSRKAINDINIIATLTITKPIIQLITSHPIDSGLLIQTTPMPLLPVL